ncbi:MAG: IclR family transcriptional regulator [Acidobacteria bacterium]|nr:MAG: IclR family transcriptional regulator [Acidobacteriota bacterium]
MKRAAATVPGPGRYTVDAAAKALELLSTFSFHERRLSLSELAARTGIPRATAFRLLSTLEAARFVTKAGGEYQLGLKCFMLGNVVAADLDLREIARPHLVALRDVTRETTQIAILDHWQVVYLERVPSPQPVGIMRARTGAILPAYCTALGKTLLAYEPREAVAAWAATQAFAALTPHTITSARRLLKELRATRERGYGIDEQERELGVRCVAAPVRNHEGRIVAAISVAGPTERMPRTLVDSDVATTVVAAAQAISMDLGAGSIAGEDAAQPAHGGRR